MSGLFTFDNYADDYTTKDKWQVGDPWEDRFTGIALDGRDRGLEDHVNADYVQREFTATVSQGGVVATDVIYATYTRGAKVVVDLALAVRAGGAAGQIFVRTTGLPAGRPVTTPFLGINEANLGTFIYFDAGTAIIAGVCLWAGDQSLMTLYSGGSHTAGIGFDPAFLCANGDNVILNWSYTPALDA